MKLAVGLILIFMSIVHIVYGEKMQVNVLKKFKVDSILIGSYRVMSVQGGVLLFAIGIIDILCFAEVVTLTGVASYFPLGILCLNVLSVFIVSFMKHIELIKTTIPQFIIFLIIIGLEFASVI